MKSSLETLLEMHDQMHLIAFWNQLNASRQATLEAEIRAIDFERIARLYQQRDALSDLGAMAKRSRPPAAFRLNGQGNRFSADEARQRGIEALRDGRVGVILVAGGQGTRLGFNHPKGMFPIGPVSGKSLFQFHIEKMLAAARRYGKPVPLYLMTSPVTHDETVDFLARHDRFGLPERDLRVFCQGTMPAVDATTGKLLLDGPEHLALSPDGHGGTLAALVRGGSLADAQSRGIEQLFYFQVDNPLVDIAGPEFLGYHLLAGSEASSQVIAKRDPLERVGNVVDIDGRLHVIEYSDLPDDVARRRAADGSLEIWAGSIAVHVFDVAFLDRMAHRADALPFHIAKKKVPYVDASGKRIEPDAPNAIKFERFIFDLLPSAENAIVVEVDPARAFAPLKNAPGAATDTPDWVRAQLVAEHARWLRAAGVEVREGVPVEISPLLALDPEELAGRLLRGTRVLEPTYFTP
ncbi:MAG: UDPGP type 1 family protein [Pirellulales bacterium]|nr:UDPGP type 1 family protein [Pirellulales bacterium]